MEVDYYQLLKRYWGYTQFREHQLDIIKSTIQGHHVLAVLPTGTGKSLCYQLSGLAKGGLTIVVSPLIALMREQASGLQAKGVKAVAIDSSMNSRTIDYTLDNVIYDNYAFLFLSPERLTSQYLLNRLDKMDIRLLAIDEAHCISEWGHDFRPAYRNIIDFSSKLSNIPILALTATATPKVRVDIVDNLDMNNPKVFAIPPRRPNLAYNVQESSYKKESLLKILGKRDHLPAIVYTQRIKKTEEVSRWLNQNGLKSRAFYGRLSDKSKRSILEEWQSDQLEVIVATKAFGMGMDKANVRSVIHIDLPESIEAYTQEAGRAGRDNNKAHVYLLYSKFDTKKQEELIQQYFPPKAFIKDVYKWLTIHVKKASGEQNSDYKPLDLEDFVSQYNLPFTKALKALTILHNQGTLVLTDDFIHPSYLHLKEYAVKKLLASDRVSDKMKSFVKTILRMYEGILLTKVKIDEKQIASKAGIQLDKTIEALEWLKKTSYLSYEKTYKGRMVKFPDIRLKTSSLEIEKTHYEDKIQRLHEKLSSVKAYIADRSCRQVYIDAYFGFNTSNACGICDICRMNQISEISDLKLEIVKSINLNNNTLDGIIESIGFKYKLEIIAKIQRLLEEETIKMSNGRFYMNK